MSENSIDYTDNLLSSFQPELEIGALISTLLETMDFTALADKSEIDEERLKKILSLEGNPTLGEIRRLASVAGKKARLSFC